MTDNYKKFTEHCLIQQQISKGVLDNFLMNFIGRKEGMVHKMDIYEQKYRHIIPLMPKSFFPSLMGEYIMGKTFSPNGLIHKYLNHVQLLSLDKEDREFLEFQSKHPWRYCFAHIVAHPTENFFKLHDAFYEDEFLIYSPGIEGYWADGHKRDLYFLLTGFNGMCHQTYGPIIPLQSFTPDDIYFYGCELFPEVDSDATLLASIYKDPMPYMMLARGMQFPTMVSSDQVLRHMVAVDEMAHIDTETLKQRFSIGWNKNIYRIRQEEWGKPPHFASAYFNEKSGELTRYAMTETGFRELTKELIKSGLKIGMNEDYSVGISMVLTMEEILRKKIKINEFEDLFPETENDQASEKGLEEINRFLQLLLPFINAKTQPDLPSLAQQSGVDIETARSLYDQLKMKFR